MTNDGQMDAATAAETGLDSDHKGTSTFTDAIYKSPLRHFLTVEDIRQSRIAERHQRRQWSAAAAAAADAH